MSELSTPCMFHVVADQPFDLSDDQLVLHYFMANEERTIRQLNRTVVPIAAVMAVAGALSLTIGSPVNAREPTKTTLSCADYGKSILQPPQEQFGINTTGFVFDGRQISVEGMLPVEDVVRRDGAAVHSKRLGTIEQVNGKLNGVLNGLPEDYVSGIFDLVRDPRMLYAICNFRGGLNLTAVDDAHLVNGEYKPADDSAKLTLMAGDSDKVFNNERSTAYALIHESGHDVRNHIIANNTDAASVKLIHELDKLYTEQLNLTLEDYRQLHGPELASDLDNLLAHYNTVDADHANPKSKQKMKLAVEYFKHKLQQPGGLGELAVSTADYTDESSYQAGLLDINSMLERASMATSPDGDYQSGMFESFTEPNDPTGLDLLNLPDNKLAEFLSTQFLLERVLPGGNTAHSWDDSDELFALAWTITQVVSANHFEEVAVSVPEKYRAIVLKQLQIVRQLRTQLNPDSLVK